MNMPDGISLMVLIATLERTRYMPSIEVSCFPPIATFTSP
jgi:hypothetical protein